MLAATTHTEDTAPEQNIVALRRRLRWRARRGLLENDVLLTRFLDQHEHALSNADIEAFYQLLELPDNDLLDLLLARTEPNIELLTHAALPPLLQRLRIVQSLTQQLTQPRKSP